MKLRDEVAAAIHAALTSDNRVPVIEQEIADGCTLPEIAQAFAGSRWRFHLLKSGVRIAVADIDELHQSYKTALDELSAMCSGLRIQDKTISEPWHAFEQIRVRTEVARQARKITLVKARANRFLQDWERLDAGGGDPIAALLHGFGFEWTGADIVLELDQGEHPATRELMRDRHVTEISTGHLSKEGDHAKTLSDLRQATNGDSGDDVAVNLNRALHAVPLRDIADILEDTDFRYEILGTGKSFKIQKLSDLSASFTELCGGVSEYRSALGFDNPSADHGFRSLNFREPLGVACKELAIEANRVNRYLLPTDRHLEADEYVAEFLFGSGFRWNGDYEVEKSEGENKQLLEAAIAYYSSSHVADAHGP